MTLVQRGCTHVRVQNKGTGGGRDMKRGHTILYYLQKEKKDPVNDDDE